MNKSGISIKILFPCSLFSILFFLKHNKAGGLASVIKITPFAEAIWKGISHRKLLSRKRQHLAWKREVNIVDTRYNSQHCQALETSI
jgi:hypothetical protein